MQSYQEQEVSLHRLLQLSAATPDYVQVKPRGFRAILQSTVEFLEAHDIQANLLVKLPVGDAWNEDVSRYSQGLASPHQVFRFVRLDSAPSPSGSEDVVLPLSADHTWRGDYFVVVQSETFAAMVVAHRLQPLSATALGDGKRPSPEAQPPPEADDDEDGSPQLEEASAVRSSYLSVCCSVNPDLVAIVVSAICHQVNQSVAADADTDLAALTQQWAQIRATQTLTPAYLTLVDRWLNWQLARQEHLRQSASTYRRQALGMSNLSTQNEVLLTTLRLKDDFLNTVGQELRTPLTTIKTALTLLDSPHLKPPQRQRYMGMISHECDRQSALISGVLNLLQMETSVGQTQLDSLNLSEAVPPVVSTYQPLAAEKGIMLAYTIPRHVPAVSCPGSWLRQIMIHLLNNSLKYTLSGGRVWVTARSTSNYAEIEVRDTGIGISASDLPRIFDHFYRGRNLPPDETEGAGLGLTIVQQLLLYCGGTVVARSQPEEGTTIAVRLPLHRGSSSH
ncbi:histidine kinase [Nodosilinea sp. LEGE 06152]|uniref:ATP-binding protein n=1 Tax=Nodosilinea sp. LEGE 06152 TaxID=2777966 RepID=UPI0018810604|nr:ATP-binding protein [Nodosilinea sp. LEGE 06152]MBE9157245.1 histidine kinase [Nodosilinea sp. LEGE 06152]